jgi:hypothetical protein
MGLDQIGRLIAIEWDGTNGLPLQVVADVPCDEFWTACVENGAHAAPPQAVSAMLKAFASQLDVESLASGEGTPQAICEWGNTEGVADLGPTGLRVQFLQPQIVRDSTRVIVVSSCVLPEGCRAGFGRCMSSFSGEAPMDCGPCCAVSSCLSRKGLNI